MDIITGERNGLEKQNYTVSQYLLKNIVIIRKKKRKEKNLITIMGKTDILI